MRTLGGTLKVVYGVKIKDVPENFVQYYGLAVVKSGTTFSFKDLKGKDSCHTGTGKTVGWKIPVGYLLYSDKMMFTCNQYRSAADFFGKSCAPGRFVRRSYKREFLLRVVKRLKQGEALPCDIFHRASPTKLNCNIKMMQRCCVLQRTF